MIVGWFGYGGRSYLADAIKAKLPENSILITCHEHSNADFAYDYKTIHEFIDKCDLIVLPKHPEEHAKGTNRLAIALSQGKFVVCGELDAYEKIAAYEGYSTNLFQFVKNSKNSFVAEDYVAEIIKINPDTLSEHSINQRKTFAAKYFNPLNLSREVSRFLGGPEFVSIIIPHYANDKTYLKAAVYSAVNCLGPRREVLVVSSSAVPVDTTDPVFNHSCVRVFNEKSRLSFSQGNRIGFERSSPETTHYLLLNDDAILTQNALIEMLEVSKERPNAIINPLSNCDYGWLHSNTLYVGHESQKGSVPLRPNMTPADFGTSDPKRLFELFSTYLNTQQEESDPSVAPFCAMFATLIPFHIFQKVGFLSETYSNGGEDADYSFRARSLGFETLWTKKAFVMHFGGKTRKFSEDQDKQLHKIEDDFNNSTLKKNWPSGKKRICIDAGFAWEAWSLDSYKENGTGIGGSEYWAGSLAECFAADGHYTTLACRSFGETEEQYGVTLTKEIKSNETYFDVFIASRNTNLVHDGLRAKTILVMIHDIWLLCGKETWKNKDHLISKYVCLTEWHKKFVHDYHGIPLSKIEIIPNGIHLSHFNNVGKTFGGANLIWSSSPDRGLDNLLEILPSIQEKVPHLTLDVYYGFHNWRASAIQANNSEALKKIDELLLKIEGNKAVTLKGRVSQPELRKAWSKAHLWLYPTMFTETYCITALEAQASCTPIVCTGIAALPETVGDAGAIVYHDPYSEQGRWWFKKYAIEFLTERESWAKWAAASYNGGQKRIDWANRYEDYWKKYTT